ncbi:MAG TPA: hypothetical protein VG413_00275 [Candidatus Dormibacteraeota bacterium]|jgi:hypothetical protein|nr:hypothetical protein [Candidatus Dormibacteraeota bacterium]
MQEAGFRRTLGIALGLLIVQFLLGTTVNLFVKIPADHPGTNPPEYFGGVVTSVSWAILHGGLWLTLHAALGLVLLLAALGTLAQAIRRRGSGRITLATLGFVGVLGAGFNGGSFLNYHQDFSSMLMAVGFALAMAAYVALLYSMPVLSTARSGGH